MNSKAGAYRTSKTIHFLYVSLAVLFLIFMVGFHYELIDRNSFVQLGFNIDRPPASASELRENIKLNIDYFGDVEMETLQVLTTEIAIDASNIFLINSYLDSRKNTRYSLTPLVLPYEINLKLLQPILPPESVNTSISSRFFTDNSTIFFLHDNLRDSHSNSVFESLENVTKESWQRVESSIEFSFDENYVFFGSTILTNRTSQNIAYFDDSYLYYDSIIYFKNNPLIRKENINIFEIVDDVFSYKILRIEDTIWIHPIYAARNIFLQNVSDPSSFRFVGRYRQNQQLFDSLGIGMLHDLFEDSENYYSLRSSSIPMFGGAGANYLEEMEVIQLFEIHSKE